MTIIAANPLVGQIAAASGSKPNASEGTRIAADFDTFVKLLITQVKNQDPLSPQDPTQYTQQLATFSQVEQAVAGNRKLDDILASLSSRSLGDAATLIGRQIMTVDMPSWALVTGVTVDGGMVRFSTDSGARDPAAVTAVR
ncbi:flagellar hook assembly protein FlgD [Sandaracinobacteroides saxicola]|uniref:Basal-body rod modification protein FlgD n=1 Tax=Sandaracinobacteroides saxicola TaxID=2759707 RepID=A0A7G5IJZ2_9SPHN|nr:flagellar hook capping FlgD N-terminal domain-containing protein [Sandaracinobacteroides saxicola]QMW23684.1 flagellar hook assembly protein FlgD [Sandaracinobacteroides saxicola]